MAGTGTGRAFVADEAVPWTVSTTWSTGSLVVTVAIGVGDEAELGALPLGAGVVAGPPAAEPSAASPVTGTTKRRTIGRASGALRSTLTRIRDATLLTARCGGGNAAFVGTAPTFRDAFA